MASSSRVADGEVAVRWKTTFGAPLELVNGVIARIV